MLVVEHDAETIERADYVMDLGPGAGRLGGEVVARGRSGRYRRQSRSLTGRYLSGALEDPRSGRAPPARGARSWPCAARASTT